MVSRILPTGLPLDIIECSIFTGIFEFLADLCLCLGAWKASVLLHNYMTTNVFRNSMRFFDATPIGRILSRFSSDVEVVDKLSQQISDTVYCFMDVRFIYFIKYYFLSKTFDCFIKIHSTS